MIMLWRVLTQCNLACGFCAYDRRVRIPRRQVDLAEIERFARLLDGLRARTQEPMLLSWLGGEPLLWPELIALSQRLRAGTGLRLSVTSNGSTLQRPGMLDAVLDAFAEITVSVDALGQEHETLRGWPGGWELLRSAVQTLAARRVSRAQPLLRANVVLLRQTLAQFPALCRELAAWGIDEITFNPLGGRDRPEFFPAHALRPRDVLTLRGMLTELRAELAAHGVRLCGAPAYLQRIEAAAASQPMPVSHCTQADTLWFIDEHARIAPCSFTVGDYGTPTASLRRVDDLAQLRAAFIARQSRAPAPACGDCPSTHVFAKFGT